MYRYGRVMVICLVWATLLMNVQAQRFDAPSFAQPGPFAVGTRDVVIEGAGRDLRTTIWYPAVGDEAVVRYDFIPLLQVPGRGIRDGEPATDDQPFPLVIFSHGSGGSRVLGLFITEHLASHGFVVMAADHPGNNVQSSLVGEADFITNYAQRPIDVLRQINYATTVLNADDGFLAGRVDTDRIGVMGHSFGGLTALLAGGGRLDFNQLDTFCATHTDDGVCFLQPLEADIAAARGMATAPTGTWEATTDPRIKAIAAFAPWNGPILNVDAITAPTLIIVGSEDLVTPAERDAYSMYDRLSVRRSLVTFELAGHSIFVDECPAVLVNFGVQDVCSDPVWDMVRVHDITNHITTAFFAHHLRGNAQAAALLEPNAVNFTGVTYQVDG